jgi:regulator of ribonuclease activity B
MAEWYEQLLELQLYRNRDLWADLQEHGVDADRELRLGFLYVAPGEPEAQALVAFLGEETDYDLQARARPGDGDGADAAWVVIGTTQPTTVTLELLDDWAEWMIAAGAAAGPCAFDGWAAQLVGG